MFQIKNKISDKEWPRNECFNSERYSNGITGIHNDTIICLHKLGLSLSYISDNDVSVL